MSLFVFYLLPSSNPFFQTTIHSSFFSPKDLAALSVFFESYMKQYGPNFTYSAFPFKANKISHIARHVAIKNKVLRLSQLSLISQDKALNFQAGLDENYLVCESCTAPVDDS